MAPIGCGFGVVEDGLIGDVDIKHLSEHESGFTCRECKGYVEGKDKADEAGMGVDAA